MKCAYCEREFNPKPNQKFCGSLCRRLWYKDNYIYGQRDEDVDVEENKDKVNKLELEIELRRKKILKLKRENFIEELKLEALPPRKDEILTIYK